jgi:putative oxidoreductase
MIDDATFAARRPRALALLPIFAALLLIEHGLSKRIGFPLPGPGALPPLPVIAALIEVAGGLLVLVGLFTRVAALAMSGGMAFAHFMAHAPQGFFPLADHGEAAILYCFIFLYIAVAGAGAWSMDAYRKGRPMGASGLGTTG